MKKGIVAAFTLAAMLAVSVATVQAGGTLYDQERISVPGGNSSAYSATLRLKTTDDTTAKVVLATENAWYDFDTRVVNSDKESRSNWARDLGAGETGFMTNMTGLKNYEYKIEFSSDWAEVGNSDCAFRWSPDNP